MTRVYHHYQQLEEYHSGLWRRPTGEARKNHISDAAGLMSDVQTFGEAMLRALEEWPKSCEHNLSADAVNRIAWLGHAGCCIGAGSPEECTRAAWHTLSEDQQDEANRVAGEVLAQWDEANREKPQDLFSWGSNGS